MYRMKQNVQTKHSKLTAAAKVLGSTLGKLSSAVGITAKKPDGPSQMGEARKGKATSKRKPKVKAKNATQRRPAR